MKLQLAYRSFPKWIFAEASPRGCIEKRKSRLWRRFTFVGLLFGVERAIRDMLQTAAEECILETGYNSVTSVLQAKLGTAQIIDCDVARVVDLIRSCPMRRGEWW